MTILFFWLGLTQCFLLWSLYRVGRIEKEMEIKHQQLATFEPEEGWPSCALIVPVAGRNPSTEMALRSLASQDYPDYKIYMVTEDGKDPACPLIRLLEGEYSNVEHVTAGRAQSCGQKNYNQLAGIAAAGESAQVYAFADSTHLARPNFLRCLVLPIASGDASFTAGYHEVYPGDDNIFTLGYAISVLFMRIAQGIPYATQPWGGAMAIRRGAFESYGIGKMWSRNVVDDCSLAGFLASHGIHAKFSPGAILSTLAVEHSLPVWKAWMERQILFLKFCKKSQWLGLGLVCAMMATPPIWFIVACGMGLLGYGGGMGPFMALCWLCILWYVFGAWRVFLYRQPDISRWIVAFFCACFMFLAVYVETIFKRTLLWHNINYHVGKGGEVKGMERL